MKRCYRFNLLLIFVSTFYLSLSAQPLPPVYQQIRLFVSDGATLQEMADAGLTVDHVRGNFREGLLLVLSTEEVDQLQQMGIPYQIEIADLSAYHRTRPRPSAEEIQESRRPLAKDGITGFGFGSMGGFYTLDEVVQQLDTLASLYPSIVGVKQVIGTTIEGRDIYAVKISDNPAVDESLDETAVYFDALHHAREPMSMTVLIYYMYWLTENYGTDPEATYLVDNREIYFVPVVNPDGYYYNQQTDPNGGGFWRKNRRNNGGGCMGVDLNRNYSYGFNTGGSSSSPCNDTYHGTGPFSEPEVAAVRDFVAAINPPIGFSTHSVRGAYLNPYGYTSVSPEFDIYAEFAGDFSQANQYIYGRTNEILSYFSSGTTRDYLHSVGTYAWTPEIGGSGFWPSQSEIIPLASKDLYGQKYLTWVAGSFADFQDYRLQNPDGVVAGDTMKLEISVKNRGLRREASSVTVTVSSDYSGLEFVQSQVDYGNIDSRAITSNLDSPFLIVLADTVGFFTELPIYVSIAQEGVETVRDTLFIRVGRQSVLFSDDAESGMANWQVEGTGGTFDTTFVTSINGTHAFADSRYGNAGNSANHSMTLTTPVLLPGVGRPVVSYWARWATEPDFDYGRAQLGLNEGRVWVTLQTRHSQVFQGQKSYVGMHNWAKEEADITQWRNNPVVLRFLYASDGGLNGDGVYFDDIQIINYTNPPLVAVDDPSDILPTTTVLRQNFPNPFNPATAIPFQLAAPGEVELSIYNLLGQRVRILLRSELSAGYHEIAWDGRNEGGEAVASGAYFYRLKTAGKTLNRKMYLSR